MDFISAFVLGVRFKMAVDAINVERLFLSSSMVSLLMFSLYWVLTIGKALDVITF